jgi:cytochrome c-type biogenesis protein
MLPMLPIYVVYFAGEGSEGKTRRALKNSMGFVLGFTLLFVLMGAFAGTIGGFLREYNTILNIITGLLVIIFGLSFLNVINLPLLGHSDKISAKFNKLKFFSSVVFGIIFSISWTPCVGAFLGSALMQASQQGDPFKGIIMLLFYSMGLGLPFIISAVLIDRLKTVFNTVKRHYKIINLLSGIFLILIGILMMTGTFGYFLSLLT